VPAGPGGQSGYLASGCSDLSNFGGLERALGKRAWTELVARVVESFNFLPPKNGPRLPLRSSTIGHA
jgi:hypothetical protein